MGGPLSSPFTGLGRVEGDVRHLKDTKAERHEVAALREEVQRLRARLTALEDRVRNLPAGGPYA